MRARGLAARLRLLVPLLIVNGAAVYGQIAYAYAKIAPPDWASGYRLALSVLFAAAVESIAVYVGWHAHDALLQRAYATAAQLRRASYGIAVAVAGINYAHFAGPHMVPTAAAVAFGLLSFLSPWLWGLHTRRTQHVQLLAQDPGLVDDGGAEFSAQRRRAFPVRSFMARRWSIDHNVRDPRQAWDGYNQARTVRLATYPGGRVRTAWAALRGTLPTPPPVSVAPPTPPTRPVGPDAAGMLTAPAKPRTAPRAVAGKTPTPQRVASAVRKTPDATPAQIAARIGVSERTVQRHWPQPDDTTGVLPVAA